MGGSEHNSFQETRLLAYVVYRASHLNSASAYALEYGCSCYHVDFGGLEKKKKVKLRVRASTTSSAG